MLVWPFVSVEGVPKSDTNVATFESLKFELNPEDDEDDEFVDLSYLHPEKDSLDTEWKVMLYLQNSYTYRLLATNLQDLLPMT